MKKNKNEPNSSASLEIRYGRTSLPMPEHPETLAEATAEGFRLLAEEEKQNAKIKPRGKAKPKVDPSNPYLRARNEILDQWDDIKRKRILEMESGVREPNHWYDDFVKQVIKLGDKYSDEL